VVTVPGEAGAPAAFLAEVVITFVQMFLVLTVSNTPRLARYTGLFAGVMLAVYIMLVTPLSGMSMNPARTFASASISGNWTGWWVYFTAPLLGMFAAAAVYVRLCGIANVRCAKLHHDNPYRCIFCNGHSEQRPPGPATLARRRSDFEEVSHAP
jgi:aquaporin Z